jgi:hypothetical protein
MAVTSSLESSTCKRSERSCFRWRIHGAWASNGGRPRTPCPYCRGYARSAFCKFNEYSNFRFPEASAKPSGRSDRGFSDLRRGRPAILPLAVLTAYGWLSGWVAQSDKHERSELERAPAVQNIVLVGRSFWPLALQRHQAPPASRPDACPPDANKPPPRSNNPQPSSGQFKRCDMSGHPRETAQR